MFLRAVLISAVLGVGVVVADPFAPVTTALGKVVGKNPAVYPNYTAAYQLFPPFYQTEVIDKCDEAKAKFEEAIAAYTDSINALQASDPALATQKKDDGDRAKDSFGAPLLTECKTSKAALDLLFQELEADYAMCNNGNSPPTGKECKADPSV